MSSALTQLFLLALVCGAASAHRISANIGAHTDNNVIIAQNHTEKTKGEDADCFCASTGDKDEIDFDTEHKYDDPADCFFGWSRCTEYCEQTPSKYRVFFEGKSQTLSACKEDDGEMKCRCLQFYDSDTKEPRQDSFDAVNDAFSNNGHFQFTGANKHQNIKDCYKGCPDKCKSLGKKFAGCAFPF